jgi:ATP-binding cassette subfamily B protein
MLLRILRKNLRPYQWEMVIVVILQLTGAIGSLYLPARNADIINTGVVQGDRLVSECSLG